MKLQELISDQYGYFIKNVGEGVYTDKQGIAKASLATLVGMTDNVKKEVPNVYKGGLSALSGLEICLNDMDFIAQRLQGCIDNGQILNNKDAAVFVYAYSHHFKDLLVMLKGIDDMK